MLKQVQSAGQAASAPSTFASVVDPATVAAGSVRTVFDVSNDVALCACRARALVSVLQKAIEAIEDSPGSTSFVMTDEVDALFVSIDLQLAELNRVNSEIFPAFEQATRGALQ